MIRVLRALPAICTLLALTACGDQGGDPMRQYGADPYSRSLRTICCHP